MCIYYYYYRVDVNIYVLLHKSLSSEQLIQLFRIDIDESLGLGYVDCHQWNVAYIQAL